MWNWPDPRFLISLIFLVYFLFPSHLPASSARGHYLRGREYEEKGMYGLAIDEYKGAISINPYYKEAYNALGRVYYKSGFNKEAIDSFKKAIRLDPDFWQSHHNLALVYEAEGKIDEAIKWLRRAIKIAPQESRLHFDLARMLTKIGMIGDAINRYKEAIRIDTGFVWAYIKLGDLYLERKDIDLAKTYYMEAARRDPKNPYPYIHLGDLYLKSGEKNKAIDKYKEALRISPSHIQTLSRLSRLYASFHKWDDAINYSKRIVKLSPASSDAHYIIGYSLHKKGHFKGAKNSYHEALKIDPYNEVARYYLENLLMAKESLPSLARQRLAEYHIELGDHHLVREGPPLAIYQYKRAVELNPQDRTARWRLAELYAKNGFIHEGINELRKVLELDPYNEDARLRLEKMYRSYERSISKREEIDPSDLPPSGVKIVLIHLHPHPIYVIHSGISSLLDDILESMLSEFPQVNIIPDSKVKMAKKRLGIREVKGERELFMIGDALKADLIFSGTITEEPESLKLDGRVIDLKTMKEVTNFSISSSANDRVWKIPSRVVKKILDVVPIQGVIVKARPNGAIINLGARHGLKVGSRLDVIKKGAVRKDPLSGEEIFGKEEVIGQIEVVELEDRISKAKILTYGLYEAMKRFDLVRLIKENK